jgi:hypothetical protein
VVAVYIQTADIFFCLVMNAWPAVVVLILSALLVPPFLDESARGNAPYFTSFCAYVLRIQQNLPME